MTFIGSIFLTNLYLYLYGKIFSFFLFRNIKNSNAEVGILGCIIVSFFALFLNFFLPLNKFINTLLLIFPFIIISIKWIISKKDIIFVIISTLFTSIVIAFSNINTPDAGLYHLPYVQILNEHKIILGLSNLHSRFGHVSIIQYLSAINFNYIGGIKGVLIPLGSIMAFIFLYFFEETIRYIKSQEKLNLNNIFCLFVLIYISYKANRYSGYGNDAPAHLLFFYLISVFLKSSINYDSLKKLSYISTYIFLNKITLIFAFLLPFYFFLKEKKKIKILISIPTLFLFLWFLKNIFISACAIYPLDKVCFDKLDWSNKDETIKQSILGEAWSKGWPDRENKSLNMEEYLNDFKWFQTWSKVHLNYIYKLLLPFLMFLAIIILLINFFKNRESFIRFKLKEDERNKLFYLLSILILANIVFIIKFPLYRYGYSLLISLIILLSTFFIFRYNIKNINLIFKYLSILCFTIICFKQIIRINNKFEIRPIWPSISSFRYDDKMFYYEKKDIGNNYHIYTSNKECLYNKAPCTNNFDERLIHKKQLGYDILVIKN